MFFPAKSFDWNLYLIVVFMFIKKLHGFFK